MLLLAKQHVSAAHWLPRWCCSYYVLSRTVKDTKVAGPTKAAGLTKVAGLSKAAGRVLGVYSQIVLKCTENDSEDA